MGNLAITYQHIADILSFKSSISELERTLTKPNFDWDAVVVEGSRHLVLPAILCRLKAKELLHTLPKELENYLEEITSINRNRNKAILKQINTLSHLLSNHNIDHVFLKGAALLALGCYKDIAERMIGDIDILIANHQINSANEILISNSYHPTKQTFGHKHFEHKHLPRLRNDKFICAVELHRKLFVTYKDKKLLPSIIIKQKVQNNNVNIPNIEHLIRHNVLNFQINDGGKTFNSINFRSTYDTLVLHKYQNFGPVIYDKDVCKNYYNIIGLFFKDLNNTLRTHKNFTTTLYLFKLKHLKFLLHWNKTLSLVNILSVLLKRIPYFLINKDYRKDLYDDRKRIFQYFKSKNNIS